MPDFKKETKPELDARIQVAPNSGHHYFFIPFTEEQQKKLNGSETLKQGNQNQFPWSPCYGVEPDSKPLKWVRHRIGYLLGNGKRVKGVWLAVETNLGNIKRGTLISEDALSRDEYERLPDCEANNTTPYRAENKESLPANRQGIDITQIRLTDQNNNMRIGIIWMINRNAVTDVDLIVDFGNTRTVVLALEEDATRVGSNGVLSSVCRPICFLPRGIEYGDKENIEDDYRNRMNFHGEIQEEYIDAMKSKLDVDAIFDSWFMLQEPQFSEWDYPAHDGIQTPYECSSEYTITTVEKEMRVAGVPLRTTERDHYKRIRRHPQMFVEISPALMGAEAKEIYMNVKMGSGINLAMSSPKRYLWDRRRLSTRSGECLWGINGNPWTRVSLNLQNYLHGQICRYIYEDGHYWDIDHPPFEDAELYQRPDCYPEKPDYPRCWAMVWTALSIIENAYRQISAYSWRWGNVEDSDRRLRSIYVTYPSGWIAEEKRYYKEAWEQAINIFTHAHMFNTQLAGEHDNNRTDCRPQLHMEIDEAVASQLPFVYSEIRRLGQANLWIQLYGRRETDEPCPPDEEFRHRRVRIMTIDIGGGTMDSTIVEYYNEMQGADCSLRYRVMFRDCNTRAGDAVTLAIIERELLPAILHARGIPRGSKEANEFAKIFSAGQRRHTDVEKIKRITSLFFLPVVRRWLGDMVEFRSEGGIYTASDGEKYRTLHECRVDEKAIKEFNDKFQKISPNAKPTLGETDRLKYEPKRINQCIRKVLVAGLQPLAKFVAAYDVDIITLSGKISEMPVVAELLSEYLPIRPQRIVGMKDFLAGDWYPLSKDGLHIDDAKTVTAVGAAFYAATRNNLMGNWRIRAADEACIPEDTDKLSRRNFWGVLQENNRRSLDQNNLLLTVYEDNNQDHHATLIDGRKLRGNQLMIGSYIGRQKYYSPGDVGGAEQQYQLCWEGEGMGPKNPVMIIVKRKEEVKKDAPHEDDIELESVTATNKEDEQLDMSKVKLRLNTLPREGFWMETGKFYIDFGGAADNDNAQDV